jgi:hypothetical protein
VSRFERSRQSWLSPTQWSRGHVHHHQGHK